jgi:hypothetical protein
MKRLGSDRQIIAHLIKSAHLVVVATAGCSILYVIRNVAA